MTFGARIVKLPYRVTSICVAAGPVWSVRQTKSRSRHTQRIPEISATLLHRLESTHRLPSTRPDITGCPERRCGLTSTQLSHGLTYRKEVMSVFVMRLQVQDRSRMSIRPRGRIHLSYRVIARPGKPHVEIAGTCLSVDFADLDLLLGFRCTAVVMTGLDDIEREPVDVWELGR